MNEEQIKQQACDEKMSFDDKKQAEATALTAKWQHGASLVVYKCRHCRLWHIATKR